MLPSIIVRLDEALSTQSNTVHIEKMCVHTTDKSSYSPCVTAMLKSLNTTVVHGPRITSYYMPEQLFTRAYAIILKEKLEGYRDSDYVECVQCHYSNPSVCCTKCGTCGQMVCDLCEENHEYHDT